MALGKVKWFNDSKGFGFIQRSSGRPEGSAEGQEIFVHYTAIQADGHKTLNSGQEVEFDVYDGPKGQHARNVMRRD